MTDGMAPRTYDPVAAAEANAARMQDDTAGAIQGYHVLEFIETSKWMEATRETYRNDLCERIAHWWNTLVDLSPPDAGLWPTRITPSYDTEGYLRKVILSDAGAGYFTLTIIVQDEDMIDINADLNTAAEGHFHTKDMISYE